MKNFNTSIGLESPSLGKYRRMGAFLTLFALFFAGNLKAQGGCGDMTPSFINYEPCKYRVQIVNTSIDCFAPTITVILDSGEFETWSANTAGGWTGQELAPNVVQLTHSGPTMPIDLSFPMIFTLPVDLVTNGNFTWDYTCGLGEGCTLFPGIELVSCPDPQDASIIGVKYRDCGSLPYTNQTTIPGWPIQLLDADGNLIEEQVTDANGNYAFYDRKKGLYLVKEDGRMGWTPRVPASGQYTVDLAPSQQVVRNFGNCPECSCDSIYMDVVQLPFTNDTCTYTLSSTNSGAYCFNSFNISISSGSFASVTPATGWTAVQLDSQHVQLDPPDDYLANGICPNWVIWTIAGSDNPQITVSTSWDNGGVPVTCSRAFSFQCPPPVSPQPCCPMGSTFGPELVKNSDFSLGNQDFINDYNYFTPGGPTAIGSYSVLDYGQVYTANNQWACIDHTTYTTAGPMLIVDGYNGPIAWEQQVSVTAGTTYAFSAWFNNLVIPTKNYDDPQMALSVNGSPIASTPILLENPDEWKWLCAQYTATQTGLVTLQIRMLSTTSVGNDVGIDDISFKECIPPPLCVCPPNAFSNMSYRPNSGPNVPIDCGQIAFWQCLFPAFNLSGDFMCQGNGCPLMPPMFWTLNHSNLGQVDQGTMNGPGFSVSIPNASFPVPGLYTLTLAGICGDDTCYCDIIIETPGCIPPPPCSVSISANPSPFCGTGTLTANATGAAPFSYQWSHGQNTQIINVQGLSCGTVCSVSVTCADGSVSSASYTVSDNIPPVAVCNLGVGVDLDPITCTFVVTPAFVDGGSTDNCHIQNMSVSPAVITGCGNTTVTLTVTDWCNNTSTCTMGIQTLEVVPPMLNCPADITVQGYLDPAGVCKNEVTGIAPQASDNCGLLGVAHTINNGSLILLPDASGTTFNQGTTTVTYFAADLCQNTSSCSFTVTVECKDCQCPASENPGAELVMNGDFSTSGGFTSDYINDCSGQLEGQLCISANPQSVNSGYQPCTDIPSGTGGMLVVNGATISGQNVWCQPFTVTPNTNYVFSFYHTSLNNASPAQLQVSINGTAVGAKAQAPVNACVWRQHCLVWNSGSNNGSIQICIQNLNTTAQGNDFALDLISFKKCSRCAPLPAGAVLWMPMDEQGGEASISGIVNGLNAIPSSLVAFGGPDPVPGKVDALISGLGALEFNGPNPGSYASVSNDPSLNFGSGPFTIDAWVKTNMTTQTAPIVEKMSNQGGYALAITGTAANAQLTMLLWTSSGVQVITGPSINVGQWNFVAAVVDPPNVRLYVGEDPGGTSPFTSTSQGVPLANASNNNPLRIGYNPQNPHWDIAIDELEIFSTALTQTEVKNIWEADFDGKCRSLCQCGGFSKLYVRNKTGSVNQPVNCGAQAVTLPCVTGQGYHLTGVFHCDGGECAPDHTINWTLTGPGGTQSGSFSDNDPFFSIHLLPNWFSQAGNYKLTMSGDCGTQTCSCEVNLTVNCPNLCPCDAVDQQSFQQNVAKGFAAAISQKFCKACFTPLAVSDCETVNWYFNSTGGQYLGTTNGKKTFCYSFNQPGTYTVVMVVERFNPDGSSCDYAEYTRTIMLTCDEPVDCNDSTLPNAGFSDDPVAGRLDSIGSSPGWISGGSHDVYLLADGTSGDGWSMGITGNFSESGILSSTEPYCVNKTDQGMLSVKLRTMGDPIPGVDVKLGRKPPGGAPSIFLYTGTTLPIPNNPGGFCYPLAELDDLLPFDDNDWYELEIPYNLSNWAALDSCGDLGRGIPARMALFVTNLLDENQASAGPVNDGVVIDQICFRGLKVGTKDIQRKDLLRIYPNPNSGTFSVELPEPAKPGTLFRITDLAGRLVQEQKTEPGSAQQTVRAGELPNGLYFLQVVSEGKVLAIEKFVKQ